MGKTPVKRNGLAASYNDRVGHTITQALASGRGPDQNRSNQIQEEAVDDAEHIPNERG